MTNGRIQRIFDEQRLIRSSWHHTSSRYNKTDFYIVDVDWFFGVKPTDPVFKAAPAKKKQEPATEKWEAEYLEWSGTRKYPKATEVRSVDTLKGDWFYLKDGSEVDKGTWIPSHQESMTYGRGRQSLSTMKDDDILKTAYIPQTTCKM